MLLRENVAKLLRNGKSCVILFSAPIKIEKGGLCVTRANGLNQLNIVIRFGNPGFARRANCGTYSPCLFSCCI